jgi:predicted metal-dependent phosphoesterase TrpH
MGKYIDLHMHSKYSDGEFDIKNLLEKIKDKDVDTFSVTDHDSIDSVLEVEHFELDNLKYIRGVEISSALNGHNVHLLGYDFNDNTNDMEDLFKILREKRIERFYRILAMLKNEYQIAFKEADIQSVLNTSSIIGKPHVIDLLYKYGYGPTNQAIYLKYLKGRVKGEFRVAVKDSINAIKKANGFVVLAHPKEIEDEYNIDINDIIKDFINAGIDGIEAYNSLHNLKDIRKYLEISKRYNLLVSGGSDYHGVFTKPTVMIGNVSEEKIHVKSLTLVDRINERKKAS